VLLNDLVWRTGDGQLSAQGRLAYGQGTPDAQLRFTAKQLQVLSQPDRYLVLSGTGEATLKDSAVQLSGTLRADRGLIELPAADAPRVSDDVVVSGRNDQEGVSAQHARNALGFDMALDLGDSFYLKGKGLDAQLGGAVRLKGVNGALPSSSGTIQVIKGDYAAYGQRLVIDRGILNFQGPVDNPGLNIVATRKNLEVQAGVAITGSAQSPRVKLVSTPSVPDSEKLSWLVLGRGMDTANGQDFSALQLAAGILLPAGESVTLQQRIARSAGLEEISLKGSGSLESTVLTLGKRLSARAYLSYERGLAGAESLAKIDYSLTPRWLVPGQAGTTPAVDLFYTLSFD
jgi:translocation and assembly module TamB